jgi:hypothetical protein
MRIARLLFTFAATIAVAHADDSLTPESARAALKKSVAFYRTHVSANGAYLWRYSADLSMCEGEVKASKTMGWVQPPGTPSVGMAYLKAYERVGEAYLLDAAVETGHALVMGQLVSGGWDYRLETDPEARLKYAFRRAPTSADGHNVSTLDDKTTQSALSYLMRLDKALNFKNEEIHECVMFGLEALLKAQYPNGAWPQRFKEPPDPAKFPVKKASYPESWPREYPNKKYIAYYTFNDGGISDAVEVILDAWEIYSDTRYLNSALKAGNFILLAQMPDPQPAWAQQYDVDMHPVWARKFEPPAITGGESQGVIRTLIELAKRTKHREFLEPVPRAIAYFRKSLLPDGRLARFYELHTNTPLFFTKDYKLTYDGSDVPTHYSFRSGSNLDGLEYLYKQASENKPLDTPAIGPNRDAALLAGNAKAAIANLDERGAWVGDKALHSFDEAGKKVKTIDCAEFARNIGILAEYIAGPNE